MYDCIVDLKVWSEDSSKSRVHYKHVNHVFMYLWKVDYKSNMYTFMYATLILNYNKVMHIT